MTPTPPARDGGDNEAGLDSESPPGAPRWVKVLGIVVAVLVLLVVIMLVIKGGQHGPGPDAPGQNPGNGSTHDPSKRGH